MEIARYLARDLFKGKTVFVTGGGSGLAGSAFFNIGAEKVLRSG